MAYVADAVALGAEFTLREGECLGDVARVAVGVFVGFGSGGGVSGGGGSGEAGKRGSGQGRGDEGRGERKGGDGMSGGLRGKREWEVKMEVVKMLTYGSRGHFGQRRCLQLVHSVALPMKVVAHLWQVLRTRWTGVFRTTSLPVGTSGITSNFAFVLGPGYGVVSTATVDTGCAVAVLGWVWVWGSFSALFGKRGHFLQRVCAQLLQIFSVPKVTWQR